MMKHLEKYTHQSSVDRPDVRICCDINILNTKIHFIPSKNPNVANCALWQMFVSANEFGILWMAINSISKAQLINANFPKINWKLYYIVWPHSCLRTCGNCEFFRHAHNYWWIDNRQLAFSTNAWFTFLLVILNVWNIQSLSTQIHAPNILPIELWMVVDGWCTIVIVFNWIISICIKTDKPLTVLKLDFSIQFGRASVLIAF